MTENEKPNDPPDQSYEERQHALDRKRYTVEKATLFFLFVYVSIAGYQGCEMKKSVDIAHDTFIAANKPSIGVSTIGVAYAGKDATGNVIKDTKPTAQTNLLVYTPEIKNFGPVPGENFAVTWNSFVDRSRQPMEHPEGNPPSTFFPGEITSVGGIIGSHDYPAVIKGEKILELEFMFHYEGPGQHYSYCEQYRFFPQLNAFADTGRCPVTKP